MDVTIQERKVSFTAEYDITTPSATYYAKKASFSLTDHLELQESDGKTIATIQGTFSPLKHKHDIIDLGNIGPEGRPFDEDWQPR